VEGWTVCVAHQGRHGMLEGRCVAVGAEVPRPTRWVAHPVVCPTCGADQDAMIVGHGRVILLDAGTERRHFHPEDRTGQRLEGVTAGLEALQETLAALLAERQRPRPTGPPPPPVPPPPPGGNAILERYSE
jgi:hypothetical protein